MSVLVAVVNFLVLFLMTRESWLKTRKVMFLCFEVKSMGGDGEVGLEEEQGKPLKGVT